MKKKTVKKIKEFLQKTWQVFAVVGMLFQIFAPTIVMADMPAVDGYNKVTIGGDPSFNSTNNRFVYDNGYITVTKTARPETLDDPTPDPVTVTSTTFDVELGDVIKIVFTPNEGYSANLYNDSEDYSISLSSNEYEFEIHTLSEGDIAYSLTPSFSNGSENPDPPISDLKFDFVFNGVQFLNKSIGDDIVVPSDFDLDTIEEFYITKIVDGNRATYTYDEDEFTKEMIGRNGLPIFNINSKKYGDNYLKLRVESHTWQYPQNPQESLAPNILESDLTRFGKTMDDYFEFYITGMNFIKNEFKGVKVSTNVMPDNYDFTSWNGADLGETTINNPGTVTAYYGEDTIRFNSETDSPIKKIELVEGKGVPNSAVEINNNNGTVKVLSNYYNQILVKVELHDGTVGYININRIGIFIGDINKDQDTFYHGAAAMVSGNLNVETNKQRIVAVFYHEDTTTYNDYDLVANITYTDGTTETKIATGVGDVRNTQGSIIGSDYILWSGDSIDVVEKVSVTAVKKGALSNSQTFGGATFGSGSGVKWQKRQGGNA